MHEGINLKAALTEAKANHLFWTSEVLNKAKPTHQQPPIQPRDQQADQTWRVYEASKGRGKGKGGKKGIKGKAKGGKVGKGGNTGLSPIPNAIIQAMADRGPATSKHPQGQVICRNFILGRCPGWCGRAHHICPRRLPDGSFCFKNHRIRTCLEQTPP